jgi:hypothetical protein|tara:strand:+ start:40 stop:324 length:285 start_codon:yes stop_codon:yes gene_type:complete
MREQELFDAGHMTVQELINKLEEVEDKTVPITLAINEKDGSGTIERIHDVLSYWYDIDDKLEETQISVGYDEDATGIDKHIYRMSDEEDEENEN